jgi:ABC-type nitrate/sulfonate/bicarbonate transport system substrate-binding protein
MKLSSISIIAFIFALWSPSASAQETLRIGVSVRNVVLMPYYYAKDKGFFDKEGLRAEIIQIRSNLQVAGVASGELDFMSGVGTAIEATRKGVPLRVLAVLYRAPLFSLVGGSAIKRPKDLEGRQEGRRFAHRFGEPQRRGLDADPQRRRYEESDFHPNRQHHRQHDRLAAGFTRCVGAEPAVYG